MITKKTRKITALVILGCLAMTLTDGILRPGYGVKSLIKIFFFLILPLVLCRGSLPLKKLLVPDRRGFLLSLVLGLVVYGLILGAYFVIRAFFDFSGITALLGENAGVTEGNFLFVAIYISFCNSFLEELFFRGFAFLGLKEALGRKWAYVFSAGAFALYHTAMMLGWFSPLLFFMALAGLFAGGCIFNLLDETNGNIYNSWMVHMFANFGINTVGLILFSTAA